MALWMSGDDDVIAHQMADHATRVEHPEYGGGAGGVRLGVAPRLGESGFRGLGRIQPRYAVESIRLSSGDRPGPPRNGLIWACAAAGRRTRAASAADKQHDNRGRIVDPLFVSGAGFRQADNRFARSGG